MTKRTFACGPLDVPTGDLWPPLLWTLVDFEAFQLLDGADQPTFEVTGEERIFYSFVCRSCSSRTIPDTGQSNHLADALNSALAHVITHHRDARDQMGLKVCTTRTGLAASLGAELVDEDPSGNQRTAWVVKV